MILLTLEGLSLYLSHRLSLSRSIDLLQFGGEMVSTEIPDAHGSIPSLLSARKLGRK